MPLTVSQAVPVLRIFDVDKAKAFYLDYLGFTLDWEHRFDANAPLYAQVGRGGLALHLSEHHGDACPGSTVFLRVSGLADFHAELSAKPYRYARPGLERTFHHSTGMVLTDPFGNRLRFDEADAPGTRG